MNNLQITEEKAEKLNKVEDMALNVIEAVLNDEIDAEEAKVKVAVGTIGVVSRNRQTSAHNRGLGFAMAQSSLSEKELKAYIKHTNPEVRKAIKGERK